MATMTARPSAAMVPMSVSSLCVRPWLPICSPAWSAAGLQLARELACGRSPCWFVLPSGSQPRLCIRSVSPWSKCCQLQTLRLVCTSQPCMGHRHAPCLCRDSTERTCKAWWASSRRHTTCPKFQACSVCWLAAPARAPLHRNQLGFSRMLALRPTQQAASEPSTSSVHYGPALR